MELDCRSFIIKVALNLNSQETKKSNFSPMGTTTLKFYDYRVKKSSFALLDIKLWLKEGDDSLTEHISVWYSFKFIHSKVQNLWQLFSSYCYNFISNIAKQKIFTYNKSPRIRTSTSKNLQPKIWGFWEMKIISTTVFQYYAARTCWEALFR